MTYRELTRKLRRLGCSFERQAGIRPGVESEWCAIKLNVDKEADALYLRLDDSPIVESEEVSPGVVLDYNEPSSPECTATWARV